MIYVLVLVSGFTTPVVTHEFDSQASCQSALNWYTSFNSLYGFTGSLEAVFADCIAKGQKSAGSPKYVFTAYATPTDSDFPSAALQGFNNVSQCAAAVAFVKTTPYQANRIWLNCVPK